MTKTFAEDLKYIREEKKITLKDISQQTRLNVTILENIKRGDFTFQPQAYIRAFLKQYINCLGLDVEETLFDYDLARSGKYKSKISKVKPSPDEITKKEIIPEVKQNVSSEKEVDKGNIENQKSFAEEKQIEKEQVKEPEKLTKQDNEKITKLSPKNVSGISNKLKDESKLTQQGQVKEKRNFISSVFNSPMIRNISLVLFGLLVLLGIYSLVNILFIEGNNDKPEIIRQNFDEVVKEQEKKILGKRTPEEIQDSIQKAEELAKSSHDSITLTITSVSTGTVFLVTDSVNYSKPQRITYDKNEVGIFKAKKFFHISSGNTESFKATINNQSLKFRSPTISKVKITKEGISK